MTTSSANDTPPTIEVRFTFFPVAWSTDVTRELFDTLVGPDKLYPAVAWGNEGTAPLPEDPDELIDLLTNHYEAMNRSNRTTLFTTESFSLSSFELVRSEWDEHSAFGQRLFWPKHLRITRPVSVLETPEALESIRHVAEITDAPLVEIDHRAGWDHEPLTLTVRREHKRVVRGRIHAKAAAGPWRGLTHIPWRLMVGPDIVSMCGTDRLVGLGGEHAIDHGNGWWTLRTTLDPADSITDAGRAVETAIIEKLGTEFFADFDADRPAEVVPDFPTELVPDDQLLVERYGERLAPL